MADKKKSFILYCDLIHTTQYLTDSDAGKVFKWVLQYVNDEDPKPLKGLLAAVCEPIKQQLKRDLLKYDKKREQYSEAGKKSAEARRIKREREKNKSNESQQTLTNVKSRSTNLTVNDNVTVTVNDNVIKKKTDAQREKDFLSLFNQLKKEHTGNSRECKVLSKTDKNNLKQLEGYTLKDFKTSIKEMLKNEWAKSTGNQTPTHILRVENFNRYLSAAEQRIKQEGNKEETLEERAERLANETKNQ